MDHGVDIGQMFQQSVRDIILANFSGTDIDDTFGMVTPDALLIKNGL